MSHDPYCPPSAEATNSCLDPFDVTIRHARIACRLIDAGRDPGSACAEADRIVAQPVAWYSSTATMEDEEDAAFGPSD